MMRIVALLVVAAVVVALTYVVWLSTDVRVPFAQLEVTVLSLDARPAARGAPDGTGRVFVTVGYRGPTRGRCVQVKNDVKVAVGGEPARAEHWGGGRWVLGEMTPLPVHVCRNVAVFVLDGRALAPGVVAASLYDGRGRAALVAARDLLAPTSVVVESAQPAERESRAQLAVLPAIPLAVAGTTIERGGDAAWPVAVDGNRASFTVPTQWRGAGNVMLHAFRNAATTRCERINQPDIKCTANALPVATEVPFDVVSALSMR